jgi:hypothetical protein
MPDQSGAVAEIAKIRETADRIANGESGEGGDPVRVLAGLIGHLAEQLDRIATIGITAPGGGDAPAVVASQSSPGRAIDQDAKNVHHDEEVRLEEDRTPTDAPAESLRDRTDDRSA